LPAQVLPVQDICCWYFVSFAKSIYNIRISKIFLISFLHWSQCRRSENLTNHHLNLSPANHRPNYTKENLTLNLRALPPPFRPWQWPQRSCHRHNQKDHPGRAPHGWTPGQEIYPLVWRIPSRRDSTRPLALQLSEILGDDTASWQDQKITFYRESMHVAGRAW